MSSAADQHSTDMSRGEIVLAIELSNPSASDNAHAVALFSRDDGVDRLIGSKPIVAGMRSSDSLMVLIEALCAEHDVLPGGISCIVVSIGPGGYTALRISVTTAKVLAHSLGCLLIGVPTALVAGVSVDPEHRPALIALASKNQQAHCAVVGVDGTVETVGVIDASGIEGLVESRGVRSIVGDGHLASSFGECGDRLGLTICPIVLDARYCLEAACGLDAVSAMELAPLYAREPDAVTQWRRRGK